MSDYVICRVREQTTGIDSKAIIIVLAVVIASAILILLIIYLCRSKRRETPLPTQ